MTVELATFTAKQMSIEGTSVVLLEWTTTNPQVVGDALELARVEDDLETTPVYPIGLYPMLQVPPGEPTTVALWVPDVDPPLTAGDSVWFYANLIADLGATVTSMWVELVWGSTFTDDARILEACNLQFAKLWSRRNSPAGVIGGFDSAPMTVRAIDPDAESLLVGLRLTTVYLDHQTWPTVDAVRARNGIATAIDDTEIDAVLEAAKGVIIRKVTTTHGGRGMS